MILADVTWPDVDAALRSDELVLVVPLGSTEQHGPHLPFTTDAELAVVLAARLERVRPSVVVAPVLPYGSSGEHQGFPGTLSIGQEVLERVVVELVRSADAFAAVVLVSAHAGNAEPLARAVRLLRAEGRTVCAWLPSGGTDAHAGRDETSMMLHVDPARVRLDAAEAGARAPIEALMPRLRESGVRAVAPNGVLGDPDGATADEGARRLDHHLEELVAIVDGLRTGA